MQNGEFDQEKNVEYTRRPIEVQDHEKKHGYFYSSMGEVSDGHHTFDELYQYRMLYNALWINELAKTPGNPRVYKSWRHADGKPCFGKDNYFVVVVDLPQGQISNHYKGEYWNLFQVTAVSKAEEWDGHTAEEAAARMETYLMKESRYE